MNKLAASLIKVANILAKIGLALIGIIAAASTIDARFQKKRIHGSAIATLIISNEEMNDIMKIV